MLSSLSVVYQAGVSVVIRIPQGFPLVAMDVERSYVKRFGDLEVLVCNLNDLILRLSSTE
jgi:hypothetical protein